MTLTKDDALTFGPGAFVPISFIPVDSSTAIIAAAIGAGIWIWQSIEYSIKKRENKIKT